MNLFVLWTLSQIGTLILLISKFWFKFIIAKYKHKEFDIEYEKTETICWFIALFIASSLMYLFMALIGLIFFK